LNFLSLPPPSKIYFTGNGSHKRLLLPIANHKMVPRSGNMSTISAQINLSFGFANLLVTTS
jgi:hypothetical protein